MTSAKRKPFAGCAPVGFERDARKARTHLFFFCFNKIVGFEHDVAQSAN
jgi:hypothetical protein